MLGFLKCFSSIGAIIMLLVGLTFTGITIYAFINQDVFLSDQEIKHDILNSLIIVSSVVTVVSILGIVGVVRKNCCLIVLYQLFLVIFLAVFLTLGIGSQIIPDKVFEGNCQNSTNSLITEAYRLYEKSDTYFCQTGCPCSMTQNSFTKYSIAEQNILLTQYNINETNGVNSTQNCADFKNWTDSSTINVPNTLGEIQKFLQCSDWCQYKSNNNLFYRFSNVNDGKPTQTCYTALHDAFFHYLGVVGTTCFVIAAVFLLVCICNICLCCHPDRRRLQFRDRFIYVTNEPSARNYKHF